MTVRVSIGLDLARRGSHQAVIVTNDGCAQPQARKVQSAAQSLDALLRAAGGPQGCRVVLEPCGLVWVSLAAYLAHRGCQVISADTRSAHQFRKFIKRTVKSDRLDAEALARMPAANPERSRPLHVPSVEHFRLQRLVRLRAQLVKDRCREVRRLLATLEAYVPALPAVLGSGEKVTALKALLLRRFLHPQRVLDAGVQGMQQAIAEAGLDVEGITSLLQRWYGAAQHAWSIWGPLDAAGCCPVDFSVAQMQVELHLERIGELDHHIAELERHIAQAYRKLDPKRVLETLPGFGPTIAPAVRAFIGDVRRFRNIKAFVSYFGIAPRKSQSGKSERSGQRISKAGNRLLRQYLFVAADVARRVDMQLAAYYQRRRAAGWHHNKIIVAIANKLARRLYAVLKREAEGDSSGYRFYDEQGAQLDPKQSARRTRSRYPSVRAVQQQHGRAPKATTRGSLQTPQCLIRSARPASIIANSPADTSSPAPRQPRSSATSHASTAAGRSSAPGQPTATSSAAAGSSPSPQRSTAARATATSSTSSSPNSARGQCTAATSAATGANSARGQPTAPTRSSQQLAAPPPVPTAHEGNPRRPRGAHSS